jgi:transposase
MSWIKKGKEFLPNISLNELKRSYKKEKNSKAELRLLAAISRKQNKTLDDIAYSLQQPKTTIHDWLKRLEENGISAIYSIKQKGKPSKLNAKQKKELEKILSENPKKQSLPFKLWTTGLVQYIIYKNYNVSYTLSAIWKLVTKLKFGLKVPRPENKKANKKAKELFKIEIKKKFNITLNLDSRSFVLMKHTSNSSHT